MDESGGRDMARKVVGTVYVLLVLLVLAVVGSAWLLGIISELASR